jgi:predicted nucleic acid-binding protein
LTVLYAFDADVLIYAAVAGHPLGRRVRPLFPTTPIDIDIDEPTPVIGAGSVLLLPEMLAKPTRDGAAHELDELAALLGRLDLRPVDTATAELATALAAAYRLHAVDAIHLATAVAAGAERFLTNNSRDFARSIAEIDIVYPLDLPDPDLTDD